MKEHIYEKSGRKQSGFEVFVQMCWPQHKLQYSRDLTLQEIEEFNKNCQKWWYDLSEQERMRFQELADKNNAKQTLQSEESYESALNGFNSTIFAYGQTASGQTHTMLGSKADPGMMRHAVDHIFDAIEQTPVLEEQNDEKSDDEEMPELVTDSDDNANAENEASNPVLELEIAEMKDQIEEEIQKIQALTAKEFIFTENIPFVPSNPMEIPPGLAYLQKYSDPYVQDHANFCYVNEVPIDGNDEKAGEVVEYEVERENVSIGAEDILESDVSDKDLSNLIHDAISMHKKSDQAQGKKKHVFHFDY